MSEPRKYVPKSSAKEVEFRDGGSLIKLSFDARELSEFVKQNQNSNGWIALVVSRRREPSEKGATHSIYLDTWKPKEGQGARRPEPQQNPNAKIDKSDVPPPEDDIPF